jgi:alkylhydroperoxidase family enzyme
VAWIRTVSDEEAEGRLAGSFEAARGRAGRVAGIVRTMSLNPPVLEASMGLYLGTMKRASPLSRRQRELLATVVSRVNECHY